MALTLDGADPYDGSVSPDHSHEQRMLDEAYRRTVGRAVAFIDETYELEHGRPFYIMTAVVVATDQISALRRELVAAVGDSRYWHTTEALQTRAGYASAVGLCHLLGDENGSELCVITQHHEVERADQSGDRARAECLRGLSVAVHRGDRPLPGPVSLVVMERRHQANQQNYDTKIVKDLRRDGLVGRGFTMRQASPADEPLLWLPDLASMALRRRLTHRDPRLWAPIARISHHAAPIATTVTGSHAQDFPLPLLRPATAASIARPPMVVRPARRPGREAGPSR